MEDVSLEGLISRTEYLPMADPGKLPLGLSIKQQWCNITAHFAKRDFLPIHANAGPTSFVKLNV